MASDNPQSRKWTITINNPTTYGLDHETLIEKTLLFNPTYFCMADEIGHEGGTYHTHLFICSESPIRFRTITARYNNVAHVERALGSCQQNRDYICKEGKWEHTLKKETQVEGSFFEWGTIPKDEYGASKKATIVNDIKNGKRTKQIVDEHPELALNVRQINELVKTMTNDDDEYKNKMRDIHVVYLYGETGVGKTYSIYKAHKAEDICRVTDYPKSGVRFDQYSGQPILVFEEFHSQISMQEMLNYLDRYPLYLPARYYDRLAKYTLVYITSNVPLDDQYKDVQSNQPSVWKAFLRRIHEVVHMGAQLTFFDSEDDDHDQ